MSHYLATWKQLVDNGVMQRGDASYAATARPAVVKVSRSTYEQFGATITLTGDRGTVTLPAEVVDIDDDVVWVPANSFGRGVLVELASAGSQVTLSKGEGA